MKVIIAGSRTITDYSCLTNAIRMAKFDVTEVVCGMAAGADRLGQKWAIANNIPIREMPANWSKHGKPAGMIRNKQMAEYADAAIILWDGKSKGARNMLDEMKRVGKPFFLDIIDTEMDIQSRIEATRAEL